jgi:hypothetical protein
VVGSETIKRREDVSFAIETIAERGSDVEVASSVEFEEKRRRRFVHKSEPR